MMPGTFRYDTHVHTSEVSKCGKSSGAEMARMYAKAGYTGICITDHFFNGNCAVPQDLPWSERVERLCLGYEHARAAGEPLGLSVFLGWEYTYRGTDFLTYGLGPDFLLAHEDLLDWHVTTYLDRVREAGGLVSQAHPFRQERYIPYIRLLHKHVEATEVFNASEDAASNDMAQRYVAMNQLIATSGSDCHSVSASTLGAMAFTRPLQDGADFVAALRGGEGGVLRDQPNPMASVAA